MQDWQEWKIAQEEDKAEEEGAILSGVVHWRERLSGKGKQRRECEERNGKNSKRKRPAIAYPGEKTKQIIQCCSRRALKGRPCHLELFHYHLYSKWVLFPFSLIISSNKDCPDQKFSILFFLLNAFILQTHPLLKSVTSLDFFPSSFPVFLAPSVSFHAHSPPSGRLASASLSSGQPLQADHWDMQSLVPSPLCFSRWPTPEDFRLG